MESKAYAYSKEREFTGEEERTYIELNLGPQHPSTHGVYRGIVRLSGETIVDIESVIGYLHRNHEKIYERLLYPQIVPMTDRFDYLSALTNELVYVMTVEKALGIEVPERAEYLRVLFAEFQRIMSHEFYFGFFFNDIGALSPFFYVFKDREWAFELMDRVSGARLFYNYFRIGGLRNDIPDGWLEDLRKFLDHLEKESLPMFEELMLGNAIFHARTKGVGVLPADVAVAYGVSGPVLRASGVKWDVRKADPYSVYRLFDFDVPTGTKGDTYDRCIMRFRELKESIRICRQVMDKLPDGPVMGKVPRGVLKLPKGHYYQRVDSPRGEVGCYIVSDGSQYPYRFKWRSPAFVNLQVLPHLCKGAKLADLIAILASLDPVFGEVDK